MLKELYSLKPNLFVKKRQNKLVYSQVILLFKFGFNYQQQKVILRRLGQLNDTLGCHGVWTVWSVKSVINSLRQIYYIITDCVKTHGVIFFGTENDARIGLLGAVARTCNMVSLVKWEAGRLTSAWQWSRKYKRTPTIAFLPTLKTEFRLWREMVIRRIPVIGSSWSYNSIGPAYELVGNYNSAYKIFLISRFVALLVILERRKPVLNCIIYKFQKNHYGNKDKHIKRAFSVLNAIICIFEDTRL